MSGVGKCIKVVNNKHTKWKHIPVAVGGSAPKRNDLIEFEELEFYDMVCFLSVMSNAECYWYLI